MFHGCACCMGVHASYSVVSGEVCGHLLVFVPLSQQTSGALRMLLHHIFACICMFELVCMVYFCSRCFQLKKLSSGPVAL